MFHAFDNPGSGRPLERPAWMALLSRAPLSLLEASVGQWLTPEVHWLRQPETGLMMVQGRVGGTAERFNLGEVTVTRCALRLQSGHAGVAWVLGRDRRHCALAAVADALLQDVARQDALDAALLAPTRAHLRSQAAAQAARAQSTRVEFFTMTRESDGGASTEEDE